MAWNQAICWGGRVVQNMFPTTDSLVPHNALKRMKLAYNWMPVVKPSYLPPSWDARRQTAWFHAMHPSIWVDKRCEFCATHNSWLCYVLRSIAVLVCAMHLSAYQKSWLKRVVCEEMLSLFLCVENGSSQHSDKRILTSFNALRLHICVHTGVWWHVQRTAAAKPQAHTLSLPSMLFLQCVFSVFLCAQESGGTCWKWQQPNLELRRTACCYHGG